MIDGFINKLKSYIEISKFERRGLITLLFSFLIVSSYYFFKNTRGENYKPIDQERYDQFKNEIDGALSDYKSNKFDRKDSRIAREVNPELAQQLLPFDPNNDSFKELLRKGIPYKVAKNLVNYREKGGVYRKKADLAKLYAVDLETFGNLESYIELPAVSEFKNSKYSDTLSKQDTLNLPLEYIEAMDINIASLEELQKINGIGPSYAKWIIERREELGGFHEESQLLEVYRIEQETIDKVGKFLLFDKTSVIKLNINTSSLKELYAHPYLSYKEAQAIVSYRAQHGPYGSNKDINHLYIFEGKDLRRLLPYLAAN